MFTLFFYVFGVVNIILLVLVVVDGITLTDKTKDNTYLERIKMLLRKEL